MCNFGNCLKNVLYAFKMHGSKSLLLGLWTTKIDFCKSTQYQFHCCIVLAQSHDPEAMLIAN